MNSQEILFCGLAVGYMFSVATGPNQNIVKEGKKISKMFMVSALEMLAE